MGVSWGPLGGFLGASAAPLRGLPRGLQVPPGALLEVSWGFLAGLLEASWRPSVLLEAFRARRCSRLWLWFGSYTGLAAGLPSASGRQRKWARLMRPPPPFQEMRAGMLAARCPSTARLQSDRMLVAFMSNPLSTYSRIPPNTTVVLFCPAVGNRGGRAQRETSPTEVTLLFGQG